MNPARNFGSAFSAQIWTALWIYFIAPPLGMLLASEFFVRLRGTRQVICAKLHHDNDKRCIFLHCNYKSTNGSSRLVRTDLKGPNGTAYGEAGEIKCHTGNWNDHGWPIAS